MAIANWIKSLSEVGVHEDLTYTDRRSVILTNIITLVFVTLAFLVFAGFPSNYKLDVFYDSLTSMLFLSIPLILNRFRLYFISKFYLSSAPPLFITYDIVTYMQTLEVVPVSTYIGLRFYLLACACVPFIVFSTKAPFTKLIVGVLPTALLLIFANDIFTYFGVDYLLVGAPDEEYFSIGKKTLLSYILIGGACLSLKFYIERNDDINKVLIDKLAYQNKLIKQQAELDLSQVNEELKFKLDELSKREFMLNESQSIAKIGSWELDKRNRFTFWSHEMFNIFGLDKSTPIHNINFTQLVGKEDGNKFFKATKDLIELQGNYDLTMEVNTPEGIKKWLKVRATAIKDQETIIGVRGICHDITIYKESEKLLKERESSYRNLFEQSFYPIIVTDKKGEVLTTNESFSELIATAKEEIVFKNINDIIKVEENFRLDSALLNEDRSSFKGSIETIDNILTVEINIKRHEDNKLMFVVRDVTKIIEAQRKLRENEVKFRTFFESSAIGTAIVSLEGEFLEVNDQLSQITGYSKNELLKFKFRDITYSEDIDDDIRLYSEAKAGKMKTYQKEKRYIHKSGAIIWVYVFVSIVRDSNGSAEYAVTQIEDITERKHAESELIEAETKFRTLVEKSGVGVYILKDGKHDYVNPAFASLLGYTQDEIINADNITSFVHPDDKELVVKNVNARLNNEVESIQYELRGIKKNGETIWTEVFGSRIPYQGSEAIIGTMIDISSKKNYEKEHALLSSVVRSIDEAIISISIDGFINSWNQGASKIFGIDSKDAINQPLNELLPAELLPDDKDIDSIMSSEFLIEDLEKNWNKKGDIRNISMSFFPLKDNNNNVIGSTVMARDITFRTRAENAIKESQERYRELVENATEAIVIINVDTGKFVNVSKSAGDLFKIKPKDLYEMGPADVSPEFQPDGTESAKAAITNVKKAIKKGKASFDWTHCDVDGNEIPTEVRLRKIPSKDGIFVRGSIIDISERVEKEKLLAEANKKIGELKLMALRSVMSPHFIFNVLNSIQFFIGKNDRLNAINYLSTFSKLIRSILTHSVDNKIKLSEEIEMLKNYINLEMLRFENKFEFELIVDPDLEVDHIEVPSLLIQPYVENAILHGLYNKKEPGKLTLDISEKGDVIYFKIEDNGIGREAARKISQKNFPTHKSMGLKVTEERLRLINENKNVSFYIEDLKEGKKAAGTRVTIGVMT
ncbi:PAS domain S-box protein [Fulvivirga lutimaris]|uniref:PAS domain S-box protein n=1 Tax=Fulvivirga lutimaris TaxID=1819566 RepID=UPI0012BBE583|nr:PAS domain S-box protein [Fulvivirga lutimaris]MTI39884.1 PAS domain S-box protein [Fulvivirga lutimaris]